MLAQVSGEQVLKDIFARGEDVHAATAGEMFGVAAEAVDPGLRSKAKMINFGIVYGLSAYGLADRLDIPQEEAAEFIERYLARFPKVQEYIDGTIERAREDGYVTTLFGRKRRIPELRSRKWQTRSLGERLAVNTPIQGSAADIIKVAMVRCRQALARRRAHRAPRPPDPRRAAVRGSRGGGRGRLGDRRARDGGRLRARSAARRRRRRGRQLARREIGLGSRGGPFRNLARAGKIAGMEAPPPVADRRQPDRRTYERRAEDRVRLLGMAASAASMVALGLAVLFLFFAAIGTIDLGNAIIATVAAIVLAALWYIGYLWRLRHRDEGSFQRERERRGF